MQDLTEQGGLNGKKEWSKYTKKGSKMHHFNSIFKKTSKFKKKDTPLGSSDPQQKVAVEIGKWLQPLTPEKPYRKPLFYFLQV